MSHQRAVSGNLGLTRLFMLLSLALASWLHILPLSPTGQLWRPDWVCLILIFWCWRTPQSVGLMSAFLVGIGLDILNDSLWGLHAFALIWVAYSAQVLLRSLHLSSRGQQFWGVLLLLGQYHLILAILWAATQTSPFHWHLFAPVLSSWAVWPVLAWSLDRVFVHFNLAQRSMLR